MRVTMLRRGAFLALWLSGAAVLFAQTAQVPPVVVTGGGPNTIPVPVGQGGTGKTSWTVGSIPCATAATTFGEVAPGTSPQVLTSNGTGACPTFQAIPSSGVTSITGTAVEIAASASTGAVTLSFPSGHSGTGAVALVTLPVFTAGITLGDNLNMPAAKNIIFGAQGAIGNGSSNGLWILKKNGFTTGQGLDGSVDGVLWMKTFGFVDAGLFKVRTVEATATTVSALPASPEEGMRASVTDSNAVSFTAGIGSVVAGGGSTHVPVYYDGSAWRIG